jgi:hypothetical protein
LCAKLEKKRKEVVGFHKGRREGREKIEIRKKFVKGQLKFSGFVRTVEIAESAKME